MPYLTFLASSFLVGLYWRFVLGTLSEEQREAIVFNLCLGRF